jgi:NCAIR mutase (PurE)-related protein
MEENQIKKLLASIAQGEISAEDGYKQLRNYPFESVEGFAVLDHQREMRTGFPEVIFGQGKTDDQIVEIFLRLKAKNPNVMASRISAEVYARIKDRLPFAVYDSMSRILYTKEKDGSIPGITVVTAGTGDIPVAEEAALTCELMGNKVQRIYDVGVSGLHRLIHRLDDVQQSNVIIVVAGMEGALASVVGGLVQCPVIAVPTSIGYGASFHGLAALLAMLNSCASGVAVVNIDNGFGAGCMASRINQLAGR